MYTSDRSRHLVEAFTTSRTGARITSAMLQEQLRQDLSALARTTTGARNAMQKMLGAYGKANALTTDEVQVLDAALAVVGKLAGAAKDAVTEVKSVAEVTRNTENKRQAAAIAARRQVFGDITFEQAVAFAIADSGMGYHLSKLRELSGSELDQWNVDYHSGKLQENVADSVTRYVERLMCEEGTTKPDCALAAAMTVKAKIDERLATRRASVDEALRDVRSVQQRAKG